MAQSISDSPQLVTVVTSTSSNHSDFTTSTKVLLIQVLMMEQLELQLVVLERMLEMMMTVMTEL